MADLNQVPVTQSARPAINQPQAPGLLVTGIVQMQLQPSLSQL